MKSNHINYDYLKSFDRIDKIIDGSDNSFEEVDSIPLRDKLSYNNGFYVNCSAIFVDIRKSSQLTNVHLRPKLAKLYRVFISEVVATMNGNALCAEINIIGDCVSGIFNTPYRQNIDGVLSTAAQIASLIDVINCKFSKKGIEQIEVGIGISYGRALMIKAGYNGSGINDIVWVGDVVNESSKLCDASDDNQIVVSKTFYDNLNDENQELFKYDYFEKVYYNKIHDVDMNNWYKENCKQENSWF
ncbi:adenylate/guanylate cyclase domain-containing protein [Methanococcoides methylutens]|uniref:Guanylate cyclase domain-containing protein n=1 Tax=Methanococcoides methylutens MM1 TaxID=1434104 RepID=A0A0E3ST89_METMT|nr:adenylate/guanylate cyclase domain-containing protein [Methanococcoides methylutens]AKB85983.1 hypothetical protein MCMEM_1930 [Methanococcoides methylutens MM1]